VFVANCARCRGQSAEGGFGPQLAGGAAVQKFPNAADQATFVEGHTPPAFRDPLVRKTATSWSTRAHSGDGLGRLELRKADFVRASGLPLRTGVE